MAARVVPDAISERRGLGPGHRLRAAALKRQRGPRAALARERCHPPKALVTQRLMGLPRRAGDVSWVSEGGPEGSSAFGATGASLSAAVKAPTTRLVYTI